MSRYSREDLSVALGRLGVLPGDTLMVRADLGAIGRISSKDRNDYVAFFLDAIGTEGTLIGLAFTGCTALARNLKAKEVFNGSNPAYTGSFANLMLSYPGSVRSRHPSNSYVAIGYRAEEILAGHDETSGAYEPVREVMKRKGKMILIGCAGTSPGFTTTHLAEVDLGRHKRILFSRRHRCRYLKDGEIKIFRRPDLGSCSASFYRFYGLYAKHEVLRQGHVGNAYALMVDAQSAYDIDRQALLADPRITICDNPMCGFCHTKRWDNLPAYPGYFARKVARKVRSLVSPASR